MNIEQIHPNYVCQVWPHVKDMLARALVLAGGEYNIDQLQFMLVRGEHVLLVAHDDELKIHGAATVVFENFPACRVAFVSAIGGRMIAQQDLFSKLVEWCRANGATKIRGCASDSITRLWKTRFDFVHRYNIVEREI